MKKMLLVIKNEIFSVVMRPSFWFGALGLPLLGVLIFVIIGAVKQNTSASETISQVFSGPQEVRPEGYVDLSGIITEMPPSVPPGTFVSYPNEASARAALEAGEISAFYLVSQDYITSGSIIYVRPDFNPLSTSGDQSGMFNWVLDVNLAGGDMLFTSLLNGPLEVERISLAPVEDVLDEDNPLAYWTPYAITLLFYFLILTSASLLLGSISKEKENRIMEVLLTSVTPRQLLAGKIIALGLIGLGQTILWLLTTYFLLGRSASTFQLASQINLPPSLIAWGIVFFLLGFAVYASLMAGLGAMAPNLREASQATIIIILPLMIPLFFSSTVFIQDPHGALATGLSLFPLTAPVAMMARLPSGGVPWWQVWLAALLVAATAVFVVRAVAGIFRAQTLLTGQGFNAKMYFRALLGKM